MLVSEVGRMTGLTKKAIEYYAEQQLVFPVTLENGYKDYNESDLERLKKISVLRKLGLSIAEIKLVLADATGKALNQISKQKVLALQEEQMKKNMLDELVMGKSYDDIAVRLESMSKYGTVKQKLLDAFPGYYGRFICLHFARFLNEPILTEEQNLACREILSYLDNMPQLEFPEDLQAFLNECTGGLGEEDIGSMLESITKSMADPEAFVSNNKEPLEHYIAFKTSPAYHDSPVYQIETLLKRFAVASGYYDIFIPAMKKLSKSYCEYCVQLEAANEKMLALCPDLEKLYTRSEE